MDQCGCVNSAGNGEPDREARIRIVEIDRAAIAVKNAQAFAVYCECRRRVPCAQPMRIGDAGTVVHDAQTGLICREAGLSIAIVPPTRAARRRT